MNARKLIAGLAVAAAIATALPASAETPYNRPRCVLTTTSPGYSQYYVADGSVRLFNDDSVTRRIIVRIAVKTYSVLGGPWDKTVTQMDIMRIVKPSTEGGMLVPFRIAGAKGPEGPPEVLAISSCISVRKLA